MLELKSLSKSAVPTALAKAERYRLLNEPGEAESICLDVLQLEPDNRDALVMLLLALTEQFSPERPDAPRLAHDVVSRLRDPYEQAYYEGIICERRAKAQLGRNERVAPQAVYEWLREAMDHFEKAEAIRPAGNDDAILRWNACARVLIRHPHLEAAHEERVEPQFLE